MVIARLIVVSLAFLAATPASAQLFQPWEPVITPSDRALLDVEPDRLATDAIAAGKADKPYGTTVPALLELVRAKPQALAEGDLMGDWRCRSIQVNELGIFAYPYFRCRVRTTGEGLFFEKLTGSQRTSGILYRRDGASFVLLGGATVNDDPQRRYVGDTRASADVLEHNRAGLVARIGPKRLRMVFAGGSGRFEVYELAR
mgnify:FL=1|jgi:hypothetical protein